MYVDNIIITASDPDFITNFIQQLGVYFPIKDFGPLHIFLGIELIGLILVFYFLSVNTFLTSSYQHSKFQTYFHPYVSH